MEHAIKEKIPIQHNAYQGLPKYPTSFPLFKVSEPQKFQMP